MGKAGLKLVIAYLMIARDALRTAAAAWEKMS